MKFTKLSAWTPWVRYGAIAAIAAGASLLSPTSAQAIGQGFSGAICKPWDLFAGPTDGVFIDVNGQIKNGSSGNRVVICPIPSTTDANGNGYRGVFAQVVAFPGMTCGIKSTFGSGTVAGTSHSFNSGEHAFLGVIGNVNGFNPSGWHAPIVYCTLPPGGRIDRINVFGQN